jgi:hypothetical protein
VPQCRSYFFNVLATFRPAQSHVTTSPGKDPLCRLTRNRHIRTAWSAQHGLANQTQMPQPTSTAPHPLRFMALQGRLWHYDPPTVLCTFRLCCAWSFHSLSLTLRSAPAAQPIQTRMQNPPYSADTSHEVSPCSLLTRSSRRDHSSCFAETSTTAIVIILVWKLACTSGVNFPLSPLQTGCQQAPQGQLHQALRTRPS